MNKLTSLLLSFSFILTTACASSSGGTITATDKAAGKASIKEDLSAYRPKYPTAEASTATAVATPTNHVNDQVAELMTAVSASNKTIRYAQGYRILAYNGSERETVMKLRKAVLYRVPEVKDYLTYTQPNFKLKVGDFFTRIEAQQVLNQITDLMPNAQIVQDQINIIKN